MKFLCEKVLTEIAETRSIFFSRDLSKLVFKCTTDSSVAEFLSVLRRYQVFDWSADY